MQSRVSPGEPASINLEAFLSEIHTNFTSLVDLTMKVPPFLMEKKTETSIIYTSTHLALVPASPLSVYSASKAALNAFVLCLREQIRNSSVKIIKLLPAVTQTELYDYMGQSSSKLGMLGDLSTEEAYKGLASGSDQVLVGSLGPPGSGNNIDRLYKDVIAKRRMAFDGFADLLWVPI